MKYTGNNKKLTSLLKNAYRPKRDLRNWKEAEIAWFRFTEYLEKREKARQSKAAFRYEREQAYIWVMREWRSVLDMWFCTYDGR